MILFEHLFIIIARPYIKIWSKYKSWYSGVRYGIYLLLMCNLLTVFAIIKDHNYISKELFLLVAISFFLVTAFLNPKLNDKKLVEEYHMKEYWKKISRWYIIISITMVFLTFWIFVVGI